MSWWSSPAQLDDDQQAVIAEPTGQSIVLTGPPGSGKTNLLVLRANYLLKQEIRAIKVLSFTRNLRLFLRAGASRYNFPDAYLRTYNSWARSVLREHQHELPSADVDFEESRRQLNAGLREVATNRTSPVLDYLLLDEVQDYTAEEVQTLMKLARYIYAVGDENQQIYQGRDGLGYLLRHVENHRRLRYHYRSSSKICRIADSVMGIVDTPAALESTSHYDEVSLPSSVIARGGLDLTQQLHRTVQELPAQLAAYPDDPIAVIAPTRATTRIAQDVLAGSEVGDFVQALTSDEQVQEIDPRRRILVSTVHAAKGLEFRCLHLLAADQFRSFGEAQRRLAYTALSRAQTSLRVYHDGPVPSYLATAIAEYYPRVLPRGIGAAFE